MKDHTPQLEDGYVRFATEWLEEFIKADYPGAVKEFVLVIARETWGWNTTWREIPAPRIAELLGVSVARVKQLRDHAVSKNLVEWTPGKGHGSSGHYRVQKDYGDWIPQRVSGTWAKRYGADNTGKNVLSGEDVLSGNDVLSATGKDVLSGDRQERAIHLIDKDRHSKDSTPERLLPDPAAPAIAEPVDKPKETLELPGTSGNHPEPPPKPPRQKSARNLLHEHCLAAFGVDPADLDSEAWAKYAKAMNSLIGATCEEQVQAWADTAIAEGGRSLGTGAKPEIKIPAAIRKEVTASEWQAAYSSARVKQQPGGNGKGGNGQAFLLNKQGVKVYERDWTEEQLASINLGRRFGKWDEERGMGFDDPRHPDKQSGRAQ